MLLFFLRLGTGNRGWACILCWSLVLFCISFVFFWFVGVGFIFWGFEVVFVSRVGFFRELGYYFYDVKVYMSFWFRF